MAVFEHRLRIRFQHTDPAGIVFFANLLVYCHEAYEELLRSAGFPLEALIQKREYSLPLGHAEVTFKRPVRHGQLVAVRVMVGKLSERSFRLDYELFDEGGELLATAATAHICVDPSSMRSTAIPAGLRAALARYAQPAAAG